jgi:hypothetical protein
MLVKLTDEVQEYVKSITGQGAELVTKVHMEDEMYLFFTTHPDHQKFPLKSYFISGVGMIQRGVLRAI